MSASTAAPPAERVSSLGPGALLVRAVGIALWRAADPDSLPVPDPGASGAAGRAAVAGASSLPRVVAAILVVIALAALGVGTVAWLAVGNAVSDFIHTPPGTPLSVTADRLAHRVDGTWWSALYPSVPARLDRAAESIRSGETELRDLAGVYGRDRLALDRRGLPARLLGGAAAVAPVAAALDRVRTPWHRGTLVYQEIEEAVRPYREGGAEAPAKLTAVLVQAPPDHALVAEVTGPDGSRLAASPTLDMGGTLTLPLVAGARIRFTSLVRPEAGAAYRVEGETAFALEDWPRSEFTVPGSGAFAFRFDPEAVRKAPPLPPLSAAAQAEIAPGAGNTAR